MELRLGLALTRGRGGGWVPLPDSAIDMDFVTGNYYGGTEANLLSITRGSSGTAEDTSGNLTTFTANTLRRTNKGLLIEEARTNLLFRSQELDNASWSKTLATVDANAGDAPDATTTAERINFTANAAAQITQSQTLTAVTYIVSMWTRAESGTKAFRFKYFDGTTTTQSADQTATTTWQRFSWSFTGVAAAGNVGVINASAAAGAVLAWGAQLELGSFATSYIPTTTAATLRNLDAVDLLGAAIMAAGGAAGTILIDADASPGAASNVLFDAFLAADTTKNVSLWSNAINWRYQVAATTVTGALRASGKTALAWNAATFQGSFAGVNTADTALVANPTLDSARLGRSRTGTGAHNAPIRRVTIWNTRKSAAELQALTA